MPDRIMYQGDAYVVLEPNQSEQYLSEAELLAKLQAILQQRQADLPRDLQQLETVEAQARHLMETACEFDVAPGQYLQWYLVRLEK